MSFRIPVHSSATERFVQKLLEDKELLRELESSLVHGLTGIKQSDRVTFSGNRVTDYIIDGPAERVAAIVRQFAYRIASRIEPDIRQEVDARARERIEANLAELAKQILR